MAPNASGAALASAVRCCWHAYSPSWIAGGSSLIRLAIHLDSRLDHDPVRLGVFQQRFPYGTSSATGAGACNAPMPLTELTAGHHLVKYTVD